MCWSSVSAKYGWWMMVRLWYCHPSKYGSSQVWTRNNIQLPIRSIRRVCFSKILHMIFSEFRQLFKFYIYWGQRQKHICPLVLWSISQTHFRFFRCSSKSIYYTRDGKNVYIVTFICTCSCILLYYKYMYIYIYDNIYIYIYYHYIIYIYILNII